MNYRGRSDDIIDILKQLRGEYDDNLVSFLTEEYTNHFVKIFEEQNKYILERQKDSIKDILNSYKIHSFEEYYKKALEKIKYSEEWCKTFSIPCNFNIIKDMNK
jgi:hypothetical protein